MLDGLPVTLRSGFSHLTVYEVGRGNSQKQVTGLVLRDAIRPPPSTAHRLPSGWGLQVSILG